MSLNIHLNSYTLLVQLSPASKSRTSLTTRHNPNFLCAGSNRFASSFRQSNRPLHLVYVSHFVQISDCLVALVYVVVRGRTFRPPTPQLRCRKPRGIAPQFHHYPGHHCSVRCRPSLHRDCTSFEMSRGQQLAPKIYFAWKLLTRERLWQLFD